jgi:hypothetical protein
VRNTSFVSPILSWAYAIETQAVFLRFELRPTLRHFRPSTVDGHCTSTEIHCSSYCELLDYVHALV